MPNANLRRRRVLTIVATATLAVGGATAAYFLRQQHLDDSALAARDAGRAALAAGEYGEALNGLGGYLERFAGRGAVADDYVQYARARRRVEIPNAKHLIGAIWSLRRALELDPSCSQARSDLVDLYLQTGYVTEGLALVDEMLAATPDDVGLLRTRRDLLVAVRRNDKAIETARRIEQLAPDDLSDRFAMLRLLGQTQAAPADVDAWVGHVVQAHPHDARFELLRAAAFARRHDDARAKASLDAVVAATADATDPPFLALLVGELDAAGRFDESARVLERAGAGADPALRAEAVRRAWYAGRTADVVALIARANSAGVASDAEMEAIHSLALRREGRGPDADAEDERLAARTDSAGRAWAAFARHAGAVSAPDPTTDLAALVGAASVVPDSALVREALGDAYAAAGETDLALEAWTRAAAQAPEWAAPLTRIARTTLLTGRESVALAMARGAFARAPGDIEVVRTYVAATAAAAGDLDPRRAESLLAAVAAVEKQAPECADAALELQIDLMSRVDAAAAARRLRTVAGEKTPVGEATLLHLAGVAGRTDPSLEMQILDRCESQCGVTPRLATARAAATARARGADAGLEAFSAARARAPAAGRALEWDIAQAALGDTLGTRGAATEWVSLADANPTALAAQLGALASESVWTDRAAVERLIERLRTLTGDGGVTWRVARARWLLTGPDATEARFAEAAKTLNDVVRAAPRSPAPRVLLAAALERLGNLGGAEEHLRIASDLSPDDPSIALEVARIAQLRGRTDAGRREIERVLSQKRVAPAQVERVAYLLAVQGDPRRGIEVLEPLVSDGRARRESALLLARLHARTGEPERALAVCERLLDAPDAAVVELAASQYAALGRDGEAAATLARLDAMKLPAGERDLVLARFAASHGRHAEAQECFRRAVGAAPASAGAWDAYLTYAVSVGAADRVREILADPHAAAAEPVRFLSGAGATSTAAIGDPRTRALVLAALHDVADRPVLLSALRATVGDEGVPARTEDAARMIRTLATGNVRVLPLQLLAADLAAATGDASGAFEIARRTESTFPDSAAAARQSAELAAHAGRWPEAVEAGMHWRDRAGRSDDEPEAFVAEALTRTGRAADAVAAVEPRMPGALADPDRHGRLLVVAAAALLRKGDDARAIDVVHHLAHGSGRRLSLALDTDCGLFGDATQARTWFAACADEVPSGDVTARVELARAWSRAWERFRTPEPLAAARAVLAPLTSASDAPATAHLLLATLAHEDGDLAGARSGYAAALARDPNLLDARNNLAIVLADLGLAKEAVAEATTATRAAPGVPEYLDTLAYALRKAHEPQRARESLDEAIRLDPANPRWMASLAETLAESGDAGAAAKVAAKAQAMAAGVGGLDPELRDRLARLARPR